MKSVAVNMGALAITLAVLAAGCSNNDDAAGRAVEIIDKGADANAVDFKPIIGDPKAGKASFAQCLSCHSVRPGEHRTGPSLYGIIDTPAGSIEGFNYSPASADSGVVWSLENLDAFLANPRDVIPQTRMVFPGISDPQVRADIVTYLATLEGAPKPNAPD